MLYLYNVVIFIAVTLASVYASGFCLASQDSNTIFIRSGFVEIDELKKTNNSVRIIHGGVAPMDADPQSNRALVAKQSLLKILEKTRILSKSKEENSISYPFGFVESSSLKEAVFELHEQLSMEQIKALYIIMLLENCEEFNSGYGSNLQVDGVARVSASYMDSRKRKFSSVINATNVKNPSFLATLLQNERFCVLDSLGVSNLARDLGIPNQNLISLKKFEQWVDSRMADLENCQIPPFGSGTVGVVSADVDYGFVLASTSTGGVGYETAGRVGDTPTVAGNFASKRTSVSCTGFGEQITSAALAVNVCAKVNAGLSLEESVFSCFCEGAEEDHKYGVIALDIDHSNNKLNWTIASLNSLLIWAGEIGCEVIDFTTNFKS